MQNILRIHEDDQMSVLYIISQYFIISSKSIQAH